MKSPLTICAVLLLAGCTPFSYRHGAKIEMQHGRKPVVTRNLHDGYDLYLPGQGYVYDCDGWHR